MKKINHTTIGNGNIMRIIETDGQKYSKQQFFR